MYKILKIITSFLEKNETPFILKRGSKKTLKPYKTIDELIKDLSSKGECPLTFTSQEIKDAQLFLTYNNYYSFSIFRKLLPWDANPSFSFTQCKDLYEFDQSLREQLNRFTGVVELITRATLVKSLCERYEGPYDKSVFYLDRDIYTSRKLAREVLRAFNSRIAKSKSISVEHHKKNRNNCYPFWLLVEELTFGEMYHFLTTLKVEYRENWIEDNFDKSYKKQFLSWIRNIQFLRNSCAHYARIYGKYFTTSRPQLLKEDIRKAKIKKSDNATLFANMLALKNVLSFSSQSTIESWNEFLEEISLHISQHQDVISLDKMGFPNNWRDCLEI